MNRYLSGLAVAVFSFAAGTTTYANDISTEPSIDQKAANTYAFFDCVGDNKLKIKDLVTLDEVWRSCMANVLDIPAASVPDGEFDRRIFWDTYFWGSDLDDLPPPAEQRPVPKP